MVGRWVGEAMSELKVRNPNRFGIVPDKVLEDRRLSLEARAVAAWLCGRQDGFTVRVEAMRKTLLGIGEKRWSAIRKELESVGWWRSSKAPTGPRGRFVWSHEFSLDGFPDAAPTDLTIPPSGMDAQSTHADSRHARGGDNHKDVHQQELTNSKPPPPSKPEAGGGGSDSKGSTPHNLDELVDAAFWQSSAAGAIKNPAGWRAKVRARLAGGATADDLQTLEQWRAAKCAAVQRGREAAERQEAERQAQARADEARSAGISKAGLDTCLSIVKPRAAA